MVTTILGVRFAPLSLPITRRLETFGTLVWASLIPGSVLTFLLLLYLPLTRYPALAYLVWLTLIDKRPDRGGGRIVQSLRHAQLWKYMSKYFPVELVKEADLDPSRNYIFGYHPHGILGLGAWTNFVTEGNEFSQQFPGIELRVCTLGQNFMVPIMRDILLAMGFASVSKRSIESVLRRPSGSVMIVVGGAQESLYARPGTLDLVLRKRLGFVKAAIRNHASLVPVLSIGENDLYDVATTQQGSIAYWIQQTVKRWFGFTVPLFLGRGIFNYSFGMLPHRRRIASIVCPPVHPEDVVGAVAIEAAREQGGEAMETAAAAVHAEYIQRLFAAWEKYKDEYAPHRVKEMELVE
ncbi:diacylglycerol acyltransferase [Blastocladiella britannica]|nr:diacylglycerol acyltransferase [Blastocladiella britannica]